MLHFNYQHFRYMDTMHKTVQKLYFVMLDFV